MDKVSGKAPDKAPETAGAGSAAGHVCRICRKGRGVALFEVPEFQFGMGETFAYFLCGACGCLQIAATPADLGRYYPRHYYSYRKNARASFYARLKAALEKKRNRFGLYGKGFLGRLLQMALPELALPKLGRLKPSKDARILDVGSGAGGILGFLAEEGYPHVTGVDPFVPEASSGEHGPRIIKGSLLDLDGAFDIIMFNHSLEHMDDNLAMLAKARALLADDGWCVVSIPTVSSEAWRRYGIHWHGLDAPRHLYLHSVESFRLLAAEAGFDIRETLYDSNTAQFWASENFRRGLNLKADGSRRTWLANRLGRAIGFIPQYLRARALNRAGQGDLVAFFLRKAA